MKVKHAFQTLRRYNFFQFNEKRINMGKIGL